MRRKSNATIIPINYTYNPTNYIVKKIRKCSLCRDNHTIRNCNIDTFPIKINQVNIKINRVNDLHNNDENECNICYENNKDTKMTFDCGHSFCGICVQKTFEICKSSKKNPNCAMCRKECNSISVVNRTIFTKLHKYYK